MGRCRKILCCAALSCLVTLFASSTRAESYARVCATTVDAKSNETLLTEKSAPAPGEKLLVHMDASAECVALVLPLVERGSRLANGWRPQMVGLPEWEERRLPAPPAVWNWNKGADPFELWIFFFKRDATGLDELQKLVAAMQNPSLDQRVLAQQTRKICEKLDARMRAKQPISKGPKPRMDLAGGSVRGTEFPWRDYTQKVVLNDAFKGVLVVRDGH
jgi:hypothetical protein